MGTRRDFLIMSLSMATMTAAYTVALVAIATWLPDPSKASPARQISNRFCKAEHPEGPAGRAVFGPAPESKGPPFH